MNEALSPEGADALLVGGTLGFILGSTMLCNAWANGGGWRLGLLILLAGLGVVAALPLWFGHSISLREVADAAIRVFGRLTG